MSSRNLATSLPTISIVTPNYNGASYLEAALRSVLSQSYPALQYVVVDGQSDDGSRLILERYRDQLSKLLIEADNGHADALNKGFAATDGEIMGWINSDDILHPGCLSQVARIFQQHPEVEWLTGRPSAMNHRGDMEYVGPVKPWSRLRFLSGDHFWIQQESTFWRRNLWERAGAKLDTKLYLANDFELWARFFRHADLYTVDRMLGCFRVRPGQRSVENRTGYQREVKQVLARELDLLEPEFRQAYQAILPDAPRELSEAEREQRATELAVLDPPMIRMERVRRSAGRALGAGGARFGTGLHTPEPVSDLSALKDRHVGERCIILGNGPSLNETDLALLEGETVFACNAVHLLFDRIQWRPSYYTCVDSQVLPDRADEIQSMLADHPDMMAFFPAELQVQGGQRERLPTRSIIKEGTHRYFFNEEPGSLQALPHSMFSMDADQRVIQPHTVAITMLQLAAYMGFSELVLVGCDTSYTVPESVKRDGGEDMSDPRLTSSKDDDPNHFDARYFGKGRKWHTPNPALMIEHYQIALHALSSRGIHVVNATVGGALEVFERRPLLEVVAHPSRARAHPEASPQSPSEAQSDRAEPGARNSSQLIGGMAESLQRNLGFLGPLGGALIALALTAAALPYLRVWIFIVTLFGVNLAITLVVAIKSRRIVMNLLENLKVVSGGKAEAELANQRLELEIDDLHAQLHELRQARYDKDRSGA